MHCCRNYFILPKRLTLKLFSPMYFYKQEPYKSLFLGDLLKNMMNIISRLPCIYLHIRDCFCFDGNHALSARPFDSSHACQATPRPPRWRQRHTAPSLFTNTKSATKTREMCSLTDTQTCQIVSVWGLTRYPHRDKTTEAKNKSQSRPWGKTNCFHI